MSDIFSFKGTIIAKGLPSAVIWCCNEVLRITICIHNMKFIERSEGGVGITICNIKKVKLLEKEAQSMKTCVNKFFFEKAAIDHKL